MPKQHAKYTLFAPVPALELANMWMWNTLLTHISCVYYFHWKKYYNMYLKKKNFFTILFTPTTTTTIKIKKNYNTTAAKK